MYSPMAQFCLQFAHTRFELVSPEHGMSLYCPVSEAGFLAAAEMHDTLQFSHVPSYRDDALHILPMN